MENYQEITHQNADDIIEGLISQIVTRKEAELKSVIDQEVELFRVLRRISRRRAK